jgi:hypothetical protein
MARATLLDKAANADRAVTDCRGFVSHTMRNWLRFVDDAELASFRRAVTDCRGFVSHATSNWLRFAARYRLPWLRFARDAELAAFRQGGSVRSGVRGTLEKTGR